MTIQALVGPQSGGDPCFPIRPAVASKTIASCTGGVTLSPPCKRIMSSGGGTLVITYAAQANGSNVTDTITLAAGQSIDVVAISIDGASTATGVTFFW